MLQELRHIGVIQVKAAAVSLQQLLVEEADAVECAVALIHTELDEFKSANQDRSARQAQGSICMPRSTAVFSVTHAGNTDQSTEQVSEHPLVAMPNGLKVHGSTPVTILTTPGTALHSQSG